MSDGAGLYLRLYASGTKSFQVQVCPAGGAGKRGWVTLGEYPGLSLKAARQKTASVLLWASEGESLASIRARLAGEVAPRRARGTGGTGSARPGKSPLARTGRAAKAQAPRDPSHTPFRVVAEDWFAVKRQPWSLGHRDALPDRFDASTRGDGVRANASSAVARPVSARSGCPAGGRTASR